MGQSVNPALEAPKGITERQKKYRITQLRAKLSAPGLTDEERVGLERQIGEVEALPVVPPSGDGKKKEVSASPGVELVKREDIEELLGLPYATMQSFGVELKRSPLGERFLIDGLERMAKRKGWNVEQLGEMFLIWSGVALIVFTPVPDLIKSFRSSKKEEPKTDVKKNGDEGISSLPAHSSE